MNILLSCVNSLVSFIGVDLERGEAFWYCPSDRLRACGAAYDAQDRRGRFGYNFLFGYTA